tara:strand:- start:1313 stop:1975 length:663 start_codon:yes stop_codon:yes gene_type:complete
MGSFTKWPQRKCLFLSGLQERKGWAKNAFDGQLLNILPPQVLVYSATYAQKKDGQLLAIFTKNTPRVKNIQFSPCALLRSTIPYQPTKKGEHKMEKRENGVSSARRSAAAFAGWLHTMRDQGRRNISCKYALRYADGILGDLSEAMRNSDSEAVYYSTADVAAQLGCSVAWARRLAHREGIGVKRATGGRGSRSYSNADLAKLREIIGGDRPSVLSPPII